MSHETDGTVLGFEDGEITFHEDIREAVLTDDAIVVCLAVTAGT
ncbi:hypothetical protein [Haloarchaeobius salinus]|nr:hypothetical protein [Haloarchaeobius salinus]